MDPEDPLEMLSTNRKGIKIPRNFAEAAELPIDPTEFTEVLEWLEANSFPSSVMKDPIFDTDKSVSINAIHKAASQGHVPALSALLKTATDINSLSQNGFTALHVASEHNRGAAIELLLDNGANIQAQAKNDSRTPLHSAALHGHVSAVELLLARGADISTKARGELTPFNYAAMNVHEAVMKLLLESGAAVDEAGTYGTTALHEAALHGRESVVRMLLEKGADVQHVDRDGRTALHRVAGGEHFEIAKLLIEEGVEVNRVDKDGFTALCFARQEKMVTLLLEKGALVSIRGKWGKTALHLRKDPGAICLLVDGGLQVDIRSDHGSTPLHEAARGLWETEARQLLAKGADVNAMENGGATPLHEAVSFDPSTKGWLREKMVRLLLNHGADPFQTTGDGGDSALSIAASRNYRTIVALFTERNPRHLKAHRNE